MIFLRKIILLLISSSILLFGCSNTLVAETANLKEVNENSIIIEYWNGETKEISISSTNDFNLELNKEYFFKYEVKRNKEAILVSVEE